MDDVDKLENYIPSCEVADIIGRDVRTVQKLTKDGTLTCEKKKNKNLYNLYTVVREYCDYVAKLGKKKISSVEEEKALEEVRIKRAKAELAELEMQELKGKLHAAEDVEQMTSDLVMVIRSSFMALPGRVAVELAAADFPALSLPEAILPLHLFLRFPHKYFDCPNSLLQAFHCFSSKKIRRT